MDTEILTEIIRVGRGDKPLCGSCREDAVVVIMGGINCYSCGNEIPMCEKHWEKFKKLVSEVK